MLVLDANVMLGACGASQGFADFRGEQLIAPPLMWSEARSGLREAMWRGDIDETRALEVLSNMDRAPVRSRGHRRLGREAWHIAEELGWAKSYDAEYLALARLAGGMVVTLDLRLRRGADRLGLVVTPEELFGR